MGDIISERIKQERKKLCSSTKEFEQKYGISASNMSKWESNAHNMRIDNVIKLANIFDCSIDYLLGIDSKPKHSYSRYYDELGLEPSTVDLLMGMHRVNNWPDFMKLYKHIGNLSTRPEFIEIQESLSRLYIALGKIPNLEFAYINHLISYPFDEIDLLYCEANYNHQKNLIADSFKTKAAKDYFFEKIEYYENTRATALDFFDEEQREYNLDILCGIYLNALAKDGVEYRDLTITESQLLMNLKMASEKVFVQRFNFNEAIKRRTTAFAKENKAYFETYISLRQKYEQLRDRCNQLYSSYAGELDSYIVNSDLSELLIMPAILKIMLQAEKPTERMKLLNKTMITAVNNAYINNLVSNYINLSAEEIESYKLFFEDCLFYYMTNHRINPKDTDIIDIKYDNAITKLEQLGLKEFLDDAKENEE